MFQVMLGSGDPLYEDWMRAQSQLIKTNIGVGLDLMFHFLIRLLQGILDLYFMVFLHFPTKVDSPNLHLFWNDQL